MEKSPSFSHKFYLSILVFLVWFALIFQCYLHINSGAASKAELLVRFFSYFTIDSNLLVALCSTSILCFRDTSVWKFFGKPSVVTAISVYITVVALIYNTILRFLWVLEGWPMVLNELLHVIVPVMFVIYWTFFVAKSQLKWSSLGFWLIYPLCYTIFVLIRGSFADFYPYPFLNVTKLGIEKVILNCVAITLLFAFLSALFLYIGRRSAKRLQR